MNSFAPRLALVGDRSPNVRAHTRIPALLTTLAERDRLILDAYWIPTEEAEGAEETLAGFDAIWLVPGSPYRSEAGAVAAARTARERKIPFLGTCGGFQHALLEYARNVCGLTSAGNAETGSGTDDPLIVPLTCSLAGHEGAVRVTAGSLAEKALGAERTVERYQCSYGLNPAFLGILREHGMDFTGVDENGESRIAELPGHPFFLVTLFQPELGGDGGQVHPIIKAFATAASENRTRTGDASPAMEHGLQHHR
jgi:CTP synthase (UTP-ammonia lyase)